MWLLLVVYGEVAPTILAMVAVGTVRILYANIRGLHIELTELIDSSLLWVCCFGLCENQGFRLRTYSCCCRSFSILVRVPRSRPSHFTNVFCPHRLVYVHEWAAFCCCSSGTLARWMKLRGLSIVRSSLRLFSYFQGSN